MNQQLSWFNTWSDLCAQMDTPPGDTLGTQDASWACFSMYLKSHDLNILNVKGLAAADPDPTQYLWFGEAVSLGSDDQAEKAYSALRQFVNNACDKEHEFHDSISGIFANWQGDSAERCREFVGAITDFIEAQRMAALEMASCVLAYRAAVSAARNNIATLMLELQSAVASQQKADADAAHGAMMRFIETAVSAGLAIVGTVATAGLGGAAAIGLAATFAGALSSIAESGYDMSHTGIDGSAGWAGIEESYLTQCGQVRNGLGDQFSGDILRRLRDIKLVEPPQLPLIDPTQ